jgi:hypothetical protein
VQVLEALELDGGLQVGIDPVVGGAVIVRAHVGLEGVAVAPAADHDQLALVAVGLPDLEIHEAVGPVDPAQARPEGADERLCALRGHAQA